MEIERISAYRINLPLQDGVYAWSGGNHVSSYDTTVLRIDTSAGITGWAEVCPLGPAYLPAYVRGVHAGISELAPRLLGEDPRQTARIGSLMDASLKGHPYVKSPFDVACWDILGKATGLPVCELLGGRFGNDFPIYRSISRDSPQVMSESIRQHRQQGIRAWQLKVGGDDPNTDVERIRAAVESAPGDLIVADANTGWLTWQALEVVNAVRDLNVAIEQPCASYEECLLVRNRTSLPLVLDECIDSVGSLVRGYAEQAMDVVNIKIAKVGGLTKARILRDVCVNLGVAMTIEDMPGGDIAGSAILHMAHSTPEQYRFSVTSSYLKVTRSIAEGGPIVANGRTEANRTPGLGVEPRPELLGGPILEVQR